MYIQYDDSCATLKTKRDTTNVYREKAGINASTAKLSLDKET